MDAEIEQLLKSLNIDLKNDSSRSSEVSQMNDPIHASFDHESANESGSMGAIPSTAKGEGDFLRAASPLPLPHLLSIKNRESHKKKKFNSIRVALLSLFFIGVMGGGAFVARELFWKSPSRIVHIYESSTLPKMVSSVVPASRHADSWTVNELSGRRLPFADLAELPSFSAHYDIIRAAQGRRVALEQVRKDVDALMANCIHAPDMASREALHRAVSRFDIADVNLTHSIIPTIVSKRPLLTTPQEQQKLNETLSYVGLGRGLEEYSKTVVQIAATQDLIAKLFLKLKEARDVCVLADTLESSLQLLEGLRKDSLMVSFIDIEKKREEALQNCRSSVEATLQQFPMSQYPRQCSKEEHAAIAFFQRMFPTFDSSLFAKVDGFLVLPKSASRVVACFENHLQADGYCNSVTRLFMAPEGITADEVSV